LSFEEALSFHGLSREVASAELIRWLESIRLENPELYRLLITDPPHMKRVMGIRIWDFAFSSGMTTDYPVRRGWNDFMAVRELVQNALDIEERLYGYEGIVTRVWVDDLGLHVADRGPGITYDAFKLGGSDKACLLPGTLVDCNPMPRPIEQVKVGDKVLNRYGRWDEVTEVHSRDYEGEIIGITPHYRNKPIFLTPDHPVLAIKKERLPGKGNRIKWGSVKPSLLRWIPAGELKEGDIIAFARLRSHLRGIQNPRFDVPPQRGSKVKIPIGHNLTIDLAKFFGLYVAEGYTSTNCQYVRFSLNAKEEKLKEFIIHTIEREFWLKPMMIRQKGGGVQIVYASTRLGRFLGENFGYKARDKKIPKFIMHAPDELKQAFLDGYYVGDGEHSKSGYTRATTASKVLAHQLRIICLSLGYVVGLLEHNGVFEIYFSRKRFLRNHGIFKKPNPVVLTRIKKVERQYYRGKVYNLEVKRTQTYSAEGMIVHNCHERGYFGEGLKVCMAYFASVGKPVYMFTRKGQVFKSVVAPGTGLVLIVMGRARPVEGTEAIVYGHFPDVETVKKIIFQEWMKDPKYFVLSKVMRGTKACPVERPHFIVSHVDRKTPVDFLWVRDISVNTLTAITGYPSIYGYNLWYVTLEPNRVAVSSVPELQREVAQIFTSEAIVDLLERVVENHSIKRNLFEVESVEWWYTSKDVKGAVAKWVDEKGYGWTDNERALDWALYLNLKPLVVPYRMRDLFSQAKTMEEMAIIKGIERIETAEAHVIKRENLSLMEACRLTAAEIVMTEVHIDLVGANIRAPSIIVTEKMDAGGTAVGEKIYFHRSQLGSIVDALESVLHEYAHYYGRRRYGEALDISEEFEKALTTVSAAAYRVSYTARQAFNRALHGAWGAKNVEWVGKYTFLRPLADRFAERLGEALKDVYKLPEGRLYLEPSVEKHIDENTPLIIIIRIYPSEEEDIKKGGTLMVDLGHYEWGPLVGAIREWGIPYPRIEMYMAAVTAEARRMEAMLSPGRTHLIFIYNPEKDNYDLWKVIPRQT
jgi:hypothetical protein